MVKIWVIVAQFRMGVEGDSWWILNIALGPAAEAVTVVGLANPV